MHATSKAVASWQPETAVVLAGSSSCEGPSYCGCCDVLNFFESTDNAQQYLRDNASVEGMPISISQAAAAGRAIFGAILREAWVAAPIGRDEVQRLLRDEDAQLVEVLPQDEYEYDGIEIRIVASRRAEWWEAAKAVAEIFVGKV